MTIRNLKSELSKIEILKRTQTEMKIELKNPTTQLENSMESLISKLR